MSDLEWRRRLGRGENERERGIELLVRFKKKKKNKMNRMGEKNMGMGWLGRSGRRVRAGYLAMGLYIYIYIYNLIKYCRAGGYPPDQNFKNRYPSVIRIFKISISVSVRIYASGRAGG